MPPPQWLVRAAPLVWRTDLHHHPWMISLWRQDTLHRETQPGAWGGTDVGGGHPRSAMHPHKCSSHQQPLLLCQGHQIPPCPKHRAARKGFSEGGELLRSSGHKSSVSPCRSGLTLAERWTLRHSPATDRTCARGWGHTARHMLTRSPGPLPTPVSQLFEISLKKGQFLTSPPPSLRGAQPQLRPRQGLARPGQGSDCPNPA